ncbi:MAG: hypothetical protein K940chlam1_00075 [Candidatus Anoxychlamydiales bacterium]|nr:hypothetical protein [Candidatus Anoxychlamydiales bacterium]NGX36726.1 hypothetical protein [Candidatus Anoxychlamydiales bacterium]
MVSLFATQSVDNKPKSNRFDGAVNVVKNGQKDFMRSMRFVCEWGRESYKSLKDVKPISNFVTGIKGAEDFLAFGEFFQSTCKVGSSVTNVLKHGVTKTYSSLKASSLEFIWNLFKVMKCLKSYGIYALKGAIFTPFMAVGGVSFAINSADKAFAEIKASNKLQNSNLQEKTFLQKINPVNFFTSSETAQKKEKALRDATLTYHFHKTVKNVGTLAVGAIVTLKALFAFSAPGIVMLTLGTVILVSNTAASIIKESNHLKL